MGLMEFQNDMKSDKNLHKLKLKPRHSNHMQCKLKLDIFFFNRKVLLEPVCCKKRQKIVPYQLLVCGVGDL